jgi:membrane protein YdbS with pleckstrin-like domain
VARASRRGPVRWYAVPVSRRILDDDEEVLVDLRPHWVFLLGPVVLVAVAVAVAIAVVVEFPGAPVAVAGVLAVMIAVPALWLVGRIARWLGISLVVTTTRLIYRRGVFSRDLVQIRLQRVTEVHCTQTIIDRLIGSGRLIVELSTESPVVIDDVRRPRTLQRVITNQLDEIIGTASGAEVFPGSEVPNYPIGVPRPVAFHDTPPHGVDAGVWSEARSSTSGDDAARPDVVSIPEQLIQLDDLRRRGIISDAEFEAKKVELLSRL